MASKEVKKVTISLPADSLVFADRLAETWSTTRSDVVVRLLKLEEQARVRALMKEGSTSRWLRRTAGTPRRPLAPYITS